MAMIFSQFGRTEGNETQGYVIICRRNIACPDHRIAQNVVFKTIFQDFVEPNVRVVTCPLLGDSPSVRANNAPKSTHLQSKIFCAATPELVLFHTEISRNPTNLFSRVVNSSCELKLLAYKKYSHVDMSAGVLYFKTKI